MGKLQNLHKLYFLSNYIAGRIPVTHSNFSQLTLLDLSANDFEREVPEELGGEIQDGIGNMGALVTLNLPENYLDGTIPAACGKLRQLHRLNLGSNKLHGFLPNEMGQMEELDILDEMDMSKNKFSGAIPTLMGSCMSLNYLNLTNSMLEGTIPESLKKITFLKVLDLSFNHLTGSVPIWIAQNSMMEIFSFTYNRLTGEVPNIGSFQNFRISSLRNVGLCSGSALKVPHARLALSPGKNELVTLLAWCLGEAQYACERLENLYPEKWLIDGLDRRKRVAAAHPRHILVVKAGGTSK
ncbi:hypothetical protein SADUNF_Sadunf13G0018300 [Salix dunnii]|uniref:Uncharacterized protein n=1 Tax=Salix dunnii TaxID=1413687 RepID=A0A835JK70_9ROSI|nr:hypothetical protein SADUNF_Sadunf13G0018300 [Salix dunnii]